MTVSDDVLSAMFRSPIIFESGLSVLYRAGNGDQRSRLYKAFQLTFDQYERELTEKIDK